MTIFAHTWLYFEWDSGVFTSRNTKTQMIYEMIFIYYMKVACFYSSQRNNLCCNSQGFEIIGGLVSVMSSFVSYHSLGIFLMNFILEKPHSSETIGTRIVNEFLE